MCCCCIRVQTLRTLGVWMLSLFVYYVLKWQGPNSAGEQWTLYSWCVMPRANDACKQYLDLILTLCVVIIRVELLGFVLMVYGTLAVCEAFICLLDVGYVCPL